MSGEGEVPPGVEEQKLAAEAVHDEGAAARPHDLRRQVRRGAAARPLRLLTLTAADGR